MECTHCGKLYQRVVMLKKHIENYHETEVTTSQQEQDSINIDEETNEGNVEETLEIIVKRSMIFNTVNCTKCEQTFSDSASLEDHTKHSHVEASCDIHEECMNKLDLLEKEQKAERQKFTHAFSEEEKSKLKAVKEVEELKMKIIVEKEEKEKREKDIIKN